MHTLSLIHISYSSAASDVYKRQVLEDKGISQTWLAKKLGRSFSTVNAYVCNRSQPNLTTLLEIAQFLSVDMKELITDKKERND